jgi:asparagine synthase (glutamine-hydrolysing)
VPTFCPDEEPALEDWADEIHTTLQEIMKEVKDEDEKADSFLSGGVDSSYVLAMSDAQMTDSCGYDEPRFDESGLAKQTADLLGRGFSRCRITPEEYFAIVPYVMENMEQPLGDASAIAFTLGCLATAKHTKLCYSGEGSDEFFGGYNMYRNAPRYGDNLKNFYVGNTNIMKEEEKEKILLRYDPENLPINLVKDIYEETEGLDPLAKMSDVDIQIWLEGDIYLNVDKMSTAAGLEIRMPLTDRRIFDIASRMPSRFKVNEEQNKVAFRTAAAKVLPEEIAFRKKLGFIVPIRIWLADERYNADVRRRLFGESAAKFFRLEEIRAIYDEYVGGNSDLWRKIWTIYTFLVWYDEYGF